MKNTIAKRLSLEKSIGVCLLLVATVVGALIHFEGQSQVLRFFDWLEELGVWAPFLFILVEMVVALSVIPGIGLIFTIGAGFMFGVLKGSLYVVVGTTLGATVAFTIARHLFSERAVRFLLTHSKLKLVNDELANEGWKIVLLTSLVPFFPFKLSNYLFGLTKISLKDFVPGVFLGIIPITITNVYIGSIAADLATLGSRSASRSHVEWVIYGIGFIIVIGTALYITRLARKALKKNIVRGKDTGDEYNYTLEG